MPRWSCATCRDRRILCDRTEPVCGQCIQSSRHCKGYGFRLFWPSQDNAKRSLFGPSLRQSPPFLEAGLVNVSPWDIELHSHLLAGSHPVHLVFDPPKPYNTIPNHVPKEELLEYFQSTASTCLSVFGHTPADLGKLLLRMALANDSPSSTAVLHSILAFSSRHRDGLRPQAADNKIAALNALRNSQGELSIAEAAQHVAAAMMLCTFETYNASCTAGQWPTYLLNAKSIIKASALSSFKPEPDHELTLLLDWVYYHDVMARFSRFHYRRERQDLDKEEEPNGSDEIWAYSPPCSNQSLVLLSQLLSAVFAGAENRVPEDYNNNIKLLEFQIRKLLPGADHLKTGDRPPSSTSSSTSSSSPSPLSSSSSSPNSTLTNLTCQTDQTASSSGTNMKTNMNADIITQTYLLHAAMLIYLHNSEATSSSTSHPTTSTTPTTTNTTNNNNHPLKSLTPHLFTTLLPSLSIASTSISISPAHLPLLLISTTATTDAERVPVLELLTRMEKSPASRNVFLLRKMVESVWVQSDLQLVGGVKNTKSASSATKAIGRLKIGGGGGGAGKGGRGGGEYGYLQKLNGVVSCCPFIPSFV
ncbi:fungal-specific transcription factor domain-containing protein [Aspergillus unguis]